MPNRVLIVRPSALGDVCRTVPVLASLKRAFPDAKIDWLVQDTFVPAIASHPDLNQALAFPRARLARWWRSPSAAAELLSYLGGLKRRRYDLVLDCQGLFRSGFLTFMTQAPVRIGFANARELGRFGVNRRVNAPRTNHAVDRMLALLHAAEVPVIKDMRLYSAASDRERIDQTLGVGSSTCAVLAPGSRWAGKLWPAARYAQLAERLLADSAFGVDRVVIVGSRGESDQYPVLIALAARDARVIDLSGKTSVGELLALIERARLVVGSDSAAVHMAVGFDRPLVALFGPTKPELVGPYQRADSVVQVVRPGDNFNHKDTTLGQAMMARISVEDAFACALAQITSRGAISRAWPRASSLRAGS